MTKKVSTYADKTLHEVSDKKKINVEMKQLSVITDIPQPKKYSDLQHFTQDKWDEFDFAKPEDIQWWLDAKFGLFVHWGPCTLIGAEIGWARGGTRGPEADGHSVPVEIYDNLYKWFNPTRFNADEWVEFAKNAGQKYLVMVTKHHDGFCLWDTKTTDYNIMNTPFKRDVVKELAQACEKGGIKFGVYFSQRDWYNKDYFTENHNRYVEYMTEQVRELLTNYGKISILWFDAWYPSIFEPEHWDAVNVHKMVRELQPGIIINNRCSLPGDYDTPEGVIGSFQINRPWETTTSSFNSWSWNPNINDTIKSFKECIDTLIGCTIGGGNLLFNVGPRSDGEIELIHKQRFEQIGAWLKKYGESVYGTRGGPFKADAWGGFACKNNSIFIHILHPNYLPSDDEAVYIDMSELQNNVADCKMLSGDGGTYIANKKCVKVKKIGLDEVDTIVELVCTDKVVTIMPDPKNGTRVR